MSNKTITFGIFGNEVTEHLPKEIIAKTGRVFEIYVSDMVPTHLCEITPSYNMEFLRLEPENRISDELDQELEAIAVYSDDTYFHVRDAMNRVHETENFIVTDDDEEKDLFETFKDNHQCNHNFSAFTKGHVAA
jgi:hypothetical protein